MATPPSAAWALRWCNPRSVSTGPGAAGFPTVDFMMDLNSLPDGISIFDTNGHDKSASWKRIPRRYIKAYR